MARTPHSTTQQQPNETPPIYAYSISISFLLVKNDTSETGGGLSTQRRPLRKIQPQLLEKPCQHNPMRRQEKNSNQKKDTKFSENVASQSKYRGQRAKTCLIYAIGKKNKKISPKPKNLIGNNDQKIANKDLFLPWMESMGNDLKVPSPCFSQRLNSPIKQTTVGQNLSVHLTYGLSQFCKQEFLQMGEGLLFYI